jgi:carboxypeptidase C (cathepsin A)
MPEWLRQGLTVRRPRAAAVLLAAAFIAGLAAPGFSQAPRPSADPGRPPAAATESQGRPVRAQDDSARKLPVDETTDQAVQLPGRTLRFKVTAGSIPLYDGDSGALQAEVSFVSYAVGSGTERPVTFVFNGGPGAASAYLNLGAFGPWRIALDQVAPSATPALSPNPETWLDFTDLVFVDPVGTGYSRLVATADSVRRHFFSIEGDAEALAVVVRKWVEKNGRQASHKFIVGESYGGFRAVKMLGALSNQGVGIRGIVLVSPVLDFGSFGQRRHAPMSWIVHLPSMAAAALDGKAPFDRAALREVEAYASGEYLRDLMRGERDAAAVERISRRVAALTDLDLDLVRRLAGRVDTGTFQRELHRKRGLVGSAYDPTITAFNPAPNAANPRFSDPMLDAIGPPLTSAMTDLYQRVLHWKIDRPYHLLDRDVSSRWSWGRGRTAPEIVDELRNALAGDRHMRALVVHGASDLVTPYFATQLILDQFPVFGSDDRLRLAVYGGGHMFYSRDASRRAFRADAEELFRLAQQRDADMRE